MKKDHGNALHFVLHQPLAIPGLVKYEQLSPLYPYRSMELSVFFVYGTDYERQINDNFFSQLKIFTFNWTNLFVILAAAMLFIIRRWHQLHCDGFLFAVIDVVVIFIGGGRVRVDHKLERWFFTIVSIGAIFLNGICLGPTLFPSFLLHHRSIETFQQLAEINPPVYATFLVKKKLDLVGDMLRFGTLLTSLMAIAANIRTVGSAL